MGKVEIEGREKTDGIWALVGQWDTGKMEEDGAKRSKMGRLVDALKNRACNFLRKGQEPERDLKRSRRGWCN